MKIRSNGFVRTGLVGVAFALGAIGCSAGEDFTDQADDSLLGADHGCKEKDPCKDKDHDKGTPAKKYSGRAIAATARLGIGGVGTETPPGGGVVPLPIFGFGTAPSVTNYDDMLFVSDTGKLPPRGGFLAESLATIDAGWLLKAGAFNASVRGEGSSTVSRASLANVALFANEPTGVLGDVLGKDANGGTIHLDLASLLSNELTGDQWNSLFGRGGPLAGGIQIDVLEEDAKAWCDGKGHAHAKADVTIVGLRIGGESIAFSPGPNSTVFAIPGLIEIYTNVQVKDGDKNYAEIDAAALQVNVLNLLDVKVGRVHADVKCGGPDKPEPPPPCGKPGGGCAK